MKSNQFQLSIPKPCSMPWDEMQSVDPDKRHCSSCDKVVVDFTSMSDEEVIRFFQKNGRTCGQLTPDQLSRTFIPVQAKKSNFTFRQMLLLPSFLLSISAAAQSTTKQEPSSSIVSTAAAQKNDTTGERPVIVKGFVSEIYTTRPIRTVIQVSNGRDVMQVFSGYDGNYSLTISCLPTDSLTITASEDWSDDFSTIIQPVAGNDVTCDVNLTRKAVVIANDRTREITRIGYIVAAKGDIAIKVRPRTKVKYFFHRLFHPFRHRKEHE